MVAEPPENPIEHKGGGSLKRQLSDFVSKVTGAAHRCAEDNAAYFQLLRKIYELIPQDKVTAETKQCVATIFSSVDSREEIAVCDHEVYALEAALYQSLPLEYLRRFSPLLRSRYRAILGDDAYQMYQDSKPPDPKDGLELELRADTIQILAEIHRHMILGPAADRKREDLSITIVVITVVTAAVALAYPSFYASVLKSAFGFNLFALSVLLGAVGASLSAQQRLQAISHDSLRNSGSSFLTFYLVPVTGAVFASVLLLLFGSGIIKGSLFPELTSIYPVQVALGTGSESKLLFWMFAAGFAERLVPDSVYQILEKQQSSSSKAKS